MRVATQLILAAIVLLGGLTSVEAQGSNTKVTKNMLKVNGVKYRREKAEDAKVASMGVMRTPIGGVFHFEHKRNAPKAVEVPLETPVILELRQLKTSDVAGMGSVKVLGTGEVSASAFAQGMRSGQYVLAKLKTKTAKYKDRINRNNRFLGQIRDQKPKDKVRIVTAVWVVISADFSSQMQAGISANASFKIAGNKLEFGGAARGSTATSVSWGQGTVFAYEVSKVTWTKKRAKIADLRADLVGMLN
ncbi:MAG: hypothetical protein AAF581_17800 [Planctomycetota bacterium]